MIELCTSALIIPNVSLADILLRAPVKTIEALIWKWSLSHSGTTTCTAHDLFEVRYTMGCVMVSVDVHDGIIFRVTALPGYTGKLCDKICVGMPISELKKSLPDLVYDEADEEFHSAVMPGVSFGLSQDDPDLDEINQLDVASISVFAPERLISVIGIEGQLDARYGNRDIQ